MMRNERSRKICIAVFGSLLIATATGLAGCVATAGDADNDPSAELAPAATLSEGFEAGTKTAYAAADVALGTGSWHMDDALIGTGDTDVKTGTKSGRIRNSGTITMNFDRTTGAGTVTIHHA